MKDVSRKDWDYLLGSGAPSSADAAPSLKPWFLLANGSDPEASLRAVANHDFSRLSWPIYVAARDKEQFQDFTFAEGLMCSEVRRFHGARHKLEKLREDKILILLPRWQDDLQTCELVDWWVNDLDRYTVELRSPLPVFRTPGFPWYRLAVLAGIVALFAWLVTR
jgi:hypothetical protein